MSLIHKPAHERVLEKGLDGPTLLDLMECMALESEAFNNEAGQLLVGYIEDEDEFKPGTYVPEIWIVLRKVLDD